MPFRAISCYCIVEDNGDALVVSGMKSVVFRLLSVYHIEKDKMLLEYVFWILTMEIQAYHEHSRSAKHHESKTESLLQCIPCSRYA